MSEPKWTPGPWERDTSSGVAFGIKGKGGKLVVNWRGLSAPMSDQGQGNSHLIAAAPDLYHCLKSIVEIIERDSGLIFNNRGQWLYAARKALSRARGEA